MLLPQPFYNRPTLTVAQDLLGCFLIRRLGSDLIMTKIVETEAYNGPSDLACHASKGRTKRTEVMFGPAGHIYVYFTYGMHYMLNIVTEEKNHPAAVLIRALEPIPEIKGQMSNVNYYNGPAKLTKALKIDKSFYGLPIFKKTSGLWIESRQEPIKPSQIIKTTRIGVDYAGEYKDKPWRFYLKDNPYISKK